MRSRYNARNNWPAATKPYRFKTTSSDGGETWAPVSFDTGLEGNSCQGSLISAGGNLSDTLFFAHPMGAGRTRMTVRKSVDGAKTWPKELQVFAGGAAYSCLSPLPSAFGASHIGLLFERADELCTQGSSCLIAFASVPADW